MASDKLFLIVALLLTSMGVCYAYLTAPTRLTVAVGPPGSADDTLMRTFSDQLKAQRTGLRLRVVPVADVLAASDALDRGEADLAVVRPDVKMPVDGLSLAVLRDAAVMLIAPRSSGVTELGDLAGKTIGVARGFDADAKLLGSILGHFDLAPPAVTLVSLERGDVVGALADGRIQAAALIAPPGGTATAEFVRGISHAFEGKLIFMPVDTPEVVSQRNPILSTTTIQAGTWGGRPKQPAEEVKTVGASYRLMARSGVDRGTVSDVLESLFQMRSRLSVKARSANFMHAPEMETSASATSAILPNHPGAVDYFQRETQSLMDRYGDWIYLIAFFGSGLASAAAWLVQRFRRQRREAIDDVLDRLLGILADARTATDPASLDELTAEVDDLLSSAIGHARTGAADSRTTTATVLALDGARAAIADRRREVGQVSGETRWGGSPPRLATVSS